MQLPANMSTPRMKLGYGEEIVHSFAVLRRRGLFGNRYGELHVTNQRVAFVKALMQGLAVETVSRFGVKPSIVFDRSAIQKLDKISLRKQFAIEIGDGRKTERFLVDEGEADVAMALLA